MKRLITILAFALGMIVCEGQINIKSAIANFEKKNYEAAITELESTLKKNERDAKTNYYLGASYVMTRTKMSEGIRRLKFAQVKGFVGDSHFYLGRAYQLSYEYEAAIASFDKFLKTAKDQGLIGKANVYRTECRNSIPLASKLFNIRVIDKYRVTPDSLLHVYSPSKEVGMVQRNSAFFESDIDPDGILYRTERGDEVFFALANGDGKDNIYKIEKLLDGWGDITLLNGLSSEWNDNMPVMMTDGTTLYFASDREGGMGGYDIYRSTYDMETRTFSEPVNMGVPFNSPFDDYLFVGDEFRDRAWFASNRETSADSLMVYEILWDESVIRSFAQNTEEIRRTAALRVDASLADMRDDITAAGVQKGHYSVTKEEKKFSFVVNDSLTYTQWEHFRSEEALSMFRAAFATQQTKDSLSAVMAAKRTEFQRNHTDSERDAIIGEVLKIERVVYNLEAQLEANYERIRVVENGRIAKMVSDGEYTALASIRKSVPALTFDWNRLLRAELYEMYSDLPFDEIKAANGELYYSVFTVDEREDLVTADSLYAWAGILSLEAQKMSEYASRGESVTTYDIEGRRVSMEPADLTQRADYLAKASAVLYGKALDMKFDVFDDRYEAAIEREPQTDFGEIELLHKSAVRDFGLVENTSINDGMEQMTRAGVMKKRGMKSFTSAMTRYMSHVDGSFPLPQKAQKRPEPTSVVENMAVNERPQGAVTEEDEATEAPKAEPEREAEVVKEVTVAVEERPAAAVENDAASSPFGKGKPVYRIQLGVFKNQPDPKKMATFEVVTQQELAGRGLVKYFAGEYRTYAEASAEIAKIKTTGFAGAFIVAFLNGEQVKLSVAQKEE